MRKTKRFNSRANWRIIGFCARAKSDTHVREKRRFLFETTTTAAAGEKKKKKKKKKKASMDWAVDPPPS